MNIQLLLIFVLIFGIVPNLGFFTFSSFFLLTVFGILAWIILRNPSHVKEDSSFSEWGVLVIYLVSATYYGGYYQNTLSQLIGQVVFFSFCTYIFTQLYKNREIPSYMFIIFFLFLSLLTIFGSPNPTVDTFVILREAPQKFLQGQNPYNSVYSQVYANIKPDYFNYLPFSIIYFIPFVYFFGDPRYGLVVAMIGTYIVINMLQKKSSSQKYLFSSLFLFAPRSFYMIEHAYLDTLIFFIFVLALFFSEKSKDKLFSLVISCFFLIKQNIIIVLPLFIKKIFKRKITMLFFILPFISVVFFFFWNPQAFIKMTITGYQPDLLLKTVPLQNKIVVPNVIYQLFHPSNSHMQVITTMSALVAFFIAIVILLNNKLKTNRKIILILFFGYFFSYHAYFNSYYLVLLFLLFDFVLSKK